MKQFISKIKTTVRLANCTSDKTFEISAPMSDGSLSSTHVNAHKQTNALDVFFWLSIIWLSFAAISLGTIFCFKIRLDNLIAENLRFIVTTVSVPPAVLAAYVMCKSHKIDGLVFLATLLASIHVFCVGVLYNAPGIGCNGL